MLIVALAIIPLYLGIQGTVSADDAVYSRALSLWPGPNTPNPLTLPETNNTAPGGCHVSPCGSFDCGCLQKGLNS